MRVVSQLVEDDSGVTAVEYALISALLSVVVLVAVSLLSDPVHGLFGTVVEQFDAVDTFMD